MTKDITIENKDVKHNYFIEDSLECGIALKGNEVKSIREGRCNLKGAWCDIQGNTITLKGMHISPWVTANAYDVDEKRNRQLLAHKHEVRKLNSRLTQQGYTLVPLKLYFVKGRVKVLIGLCKGKHAYDKRNDLKAKDTKRAIDRALKGKL